MGLGLLWTPFADYLGHHRCLFESTSADSRLISSHRYGNDREMVDAGRRHSVVLLSEILYRWRKIEGRPIKRTPARHQQFTRRSGTL